MPLARVGLLLSLMCTSAAASQRPCQSDGERPVWIDETPRGYAFDYFVGRAESPRGAVESEKLALANAIAEIGRRGRITVESTAEARQAESGVTRDGVVSTTLTTQTAEEVRVHGHSTTIQGLSRVEQFAQRCDDGVSRSSVLVRIPKVEPMAPPTLGYWAPRSLVPSWAQFEKGHPTRGWLILAGEALTIPTAIVTGLLASRARVNANASRTQSDRDFFNDRADTLQSTALIAGSTAAAIYLYSLIDGLASSEWNVRE